MSEMFGMRDFLGDLFLECLVSFDILDFRVFFLKDYFNKFYNDYFSLFLEIISLDFLGILHCSSFCHFPELFSVLSKMLGSSLSIQSVTQCLFMGELIPFMSRYWGWVSVAVCLFLLLCTCCALCVDLI